MSRGEQLPRITSVEPVELLRQLNSMVDLLNRRLASAEQPSGKEFWDVANLTRSTTMDASSATTDEVRDCLGTLISDMKTRGIIR